MPIVVEPIAYVSSTRTRPTDDDWDAEQSTIRLVDAYGPEALTGLSSFSHVEVTYLFHLVEPNGVVTGARHPRGNRDWPLTGVFAQRAKNRPNRLGSTICRLIAVEGTAVRVAGLDAIDGTPVLDLRPVMREFLPREAVTQPEWSLQLMRDYWKRDGGSGA